MKLLQLHSCRHGASCMPAQVNTLLWKATGGRTPHARLYIEPCCAGPCSCSAFGLQLQQAARAARGPADSRLTRGSETHTLATVLITDFVHLWCMLHQYAGCEAHTSHVHTQHVCTHTTTQHTTYTIAKRPSRGMRCSQSMTQAPSSHCSTPKRAGAAAFATAGWLLQWGLSQWRPLSGGDI